MTQIPPKLTCTTVSQKRPTPLFGKRSRLHHLSNLNIVMFFRQPPALCRIMRGSRPHQIGKDKIAPLLPFIGKGARRGSGAGERYGNHQSGNYWH